MGRSMGQKSTSKAATESKRQNEGFLCYCCGETKKRSEFYMSTDPFNSVGVVPFCKKCLERIARNYNENYKMFGDVTKESVIAACERADFPFLEKVWDISVKELNTTQFTNVWASYAKNIKLPQFHGLRFRDGDNVKGSVVDTEPLYTFEETTTQDTEVYEECEKNRKDIVRLIGYDPFFKEAEEDKPLLYSQLIGYLDMSGDNEDTTRVLDSIEIVRGYLQLQKLNDMSAKAFANLATTGQSGEIKNYMDTKKKVADVISQLAEQSCISLKHNKNASKGENTWTGKIKKLRSMDLREAEVNAFTVGTCDGMKQVADISNASILKQIRLDESDYVDMLSEQREMITSLRAESDKNAEKYRIVLQENYDLKDLLKEHNIDISNRLQECELLNEANDGVRNE